MIKHKLIENLSPTTGNLPLSGGSVGHRYFFRDDDAWCYAIDAHIDYMLLHGLTEMQLYLAQREVSSHYFHCRHFGEVGEKSESTCGKICKAYEPRNGKSGRCKHSGFTYEQSDRCFTLKLRTNVKSI
jgi:hypothetical protein